MTDGYVKISRSITEWRWYKDANAFRLFIHLIAKANFADTMWNDIVVHRGELVTSYSKLSNELGLTVKEVRSALGKLKRTGEVASTSTSKYTVISVTGYNEYQCSDKQNGKRRASKGQAEGKQRATNKKDNKDNNIKEVDNKKEKNIKKENFSIPPEIEEAFRGFSEMRQKIKKPLTDRAKKMAIRKLQELAPNDYRTQAEILDQSTMQCWQGLFPLKADKQNGGGKNGTTRSVASESMSSRVF